MVKKIPPDPEIQKKIAALVGRARDSSGEHVTL